MCPSSSTNNTVSTLGSREVDALLQGQAGHENLLYDSTPEIRSLVFSTRKAGAVLLQPWSATVGLKIKRSKVEILASLVVRNCEYRSCDEFVQNSRCDNVGPDV